MYHVYDSDPAAIRAAEESAAERAWHAQHVCSPGTCGETEISEAEITRLINQQQESLPW